MKRSLTLKQENACLAFVETGNKNEAYRRAFNTEKMKSTTINKRANEFFDRGDIKGRVEELRKPIIERHKITVDDLIAELDENRKIALSAETPQASAANQSTMAKAKLLGYHKQILEISGRNGSAIQSITAITVDPVEASKLYSNIMRDEK